MLALLLAGVLAAEPAPDLDFSGKLPEWVEPYVFKCVAAKPALITELKYRLRAATSKQERRTIAQLIKTIQAPELLSHVALNLLRGGNRPNPGDVGTIEIGGSPLNDLQIVTKGKIIQVLDDKALLVDAYDVTLWLDCPVDGLTDGDTIALDKGLWQYVGTETYKTALGTSRTVQRLARVDEGLAAEFHRAQIAAEKKAKADALAKSRARNAKRLKKKPG